MDEIVTCQGCEGGNQPASEGREAAGSGYLLVDRRELLKKGGLAAAALLLAACGNLGTDATGPNFSSFTVKLSDYPTLAQAGGVAQVSSPGGYPLAIENTGSGYIALGLICPHRGGPIGVFSNGFQCPVHGATFNKTGQWIGGQPTSNMARFNVSTDAAGNLTIG